jgi:hypothetical protein
MVGLGRLELPTSPLSGARSSHLSYRPTKTLGGISLLAAAIYWVPAAESSVIHQGQVGQSISVISDQTNSSARELAATFYLCLLLPDPRWR